MRRRPSFPGLWMAIVLALVMATAVAWYALSSFQSHSEAKRFSVGDTTGLVKALKSAAPGSTVVLAAGTYQTGVSLDVPDGVTVTGPRTEHGATIVAAGNVDDSVSLGDGSALSNVTIRAGGRVSNIIGVQANSKGVSIADCHLYGSMRGAGVDTGTGVSELDISRTSIDSIKNGLRLDNGPSDVRVDHVHITHWTTRGVWILGEPGAPVHGVTLSHLIIGPNVGHGLSRYPILATSATRQPNTNISIEDSNIDGPGTANEDKNRPGTSDQISVMRTDGVNIIGNRSINGGERGINVTSSSNVRVERNRVVNADDAGIGIGSLGKLAGVRNATVVGNVVVNSGMSRVGTTPAAERSGIRLAQVTGGVARSNTVTVRPGSGNKSTYGITVVSGIGVSATGNTFSGPMRQRLLTGEGAR